MQARVSNQFCLSAQKSLDKHEQSKTVRKLICIRFKSHSKAHFCWPIRGVGRRGVTFKMWNNIAREVLDHAHLIKATPIYVVVVVIRCALFKTGVSMAVVGSWSWSMAGHSQVY